MMKRILIIEDNAFKLANVRQLCEEHFNSYEIDDAQSYNSAQQEVVFHGADYSLILLDVSMNTYDIKQDDNIEQEPLAGANILRFMKLRRIMTPVIVVTMYESFVDGVKIKALDERFKTQYKDIYKGYVYYNIKNDDWKDNLVVKMKEILYD